MAAVSLGDRLTQQPLATSRPHLLTPARWATDIGGTAPDGPTSQLRWLAEGSIPGTGTRWQSMVRTALVDVHALEAPGGAVAAGAAASWRFTWPRDAAFTVAALSSTGHQDEAGRILGFLQRVQRRDGGFEARYLPDGSGPPDGRPPQADGAGWALWALDQYARVAGDPSAARQDVGALRPLLDRSVAFTLRLVSGGRRLPAPSPDYWEMREPLVTLGTAAPLLAGLTAAQHLYTVLGDAAAARRSGDAAARLASVIRRRFEPDGYQRYPFGGGHDAAVCFLMPPFVPNPRPAVMAAWKAYQREAARAGGGLAPGAGWKQDGVSWTPETALVALTAASSGQPVTAARRLDWLEAHRSPWGSLPERVLADGAPAGPAPLGWTAAAVVLTVAALDRGRAGG